MRDLHITNAAGKHFLVHVVQKGDPYGIGLVHDKDDPLIEFYDNDQAKKKFGPRGQFVQSYYASTLANIPMFRGISLHGGIDAWSVDAEALRPVITLARKLRNAHETAIAKAKAKGLPKVPKKGDPTDLNLYVLDREIKEGHGTIHRLAATSIPHIRRCLDAGLLEPGSAPKTWKLSPKGHAVLAEWSRKND